MAFVRGLMGPYMRPIPVGASAAMIFSLLVAFIVTPWLGYLLLRRVGEGRGHEERQEQGMERWYGAVLRPLLESRAKRLVALGGVVLLLGAAVALIPLKKVTVKMLPFDNKSELQVVIDMPEGTTAAADGARRHRDRPLPGHGAGGRELAALRRHGGSPYNFNGLVRHYFLRSAPQRGRRPGEPRPQGRAQGAEPRDRQAHPRRRRRDRRRHGARVKIAEIPPGPPVLSTLVAEVYGPDPVRRREIARQIRGIFEGTDGVVDVDWFVEDDQQKVTFAVDRTKAALSGISAEQVSQSLAVALGGFSAGQVHLPREKEPVELRAAPAGRRPRRSRVARGGHRAVADRGAGAAGRTGFDPPRPRGEDDLPQEPAAGGLRRRRRRRQRREPGLRHSRDEGEDQGDPAPRGLRAAAVLRRSPAGATDRYAMKWDGEWQITYEVFRDMGLAFAAVLVLIYILVVAWFRSFVVPLVIMAPIPLTLVGILPGHWALGAFFTATSMIGFIALAGIVVRNSILLVDFAQSEERETGDLKEALVQAGAVRFRPIALTAAAVVVASLVMLFDPIFQGLAISMMFGAVGATALTLIAVPLLYIEFFQKRPCPMAEQMGEACEGETEQGTPS